MPTPAIKHDDTRDSKQDLEFCPDCASYAWRGKGHRCTPPTQTHMRRSTILALVIIAAIMLAGLLTVHSAQARVGVVHPVPIPAALVAAREQCPLDQPLRCRAALVHALAAVAWAKKERIKRYEPTVALAISVACASQPAVDCAWFNRMIACESRRDPKAKNRHSTASGLGQELDGTFASTPYARLDVFDPFVGALSSAWLAAKNGHGPWYASKGCWS